MASFGNIRPRASLAYITNQMGGLPDHRAKLTQQRATRCARGLIIDQRGYHGMLPSPAGLPQFHRAVVACWHLKVSCTKQGPKSSSNEPTYYN